MREHPSRGTGGGGQTPATIAPRLRSPDGELQAHQAPCMLFKILNKEHLYPLLLDKRSARTVLEGELGGP